jgi:hypothetical protein
MERQGTKKFGGKLLRKYSFESLRSWKLLERRSLGVPRRWGNSINIRSEDGDGFWSDLSSVAALVLAMLSLRILLSEC